MSLFSTLNVATRALSASQLAIEVTSQNISNADVDGYSRKRVTLSASYTSNDIYGQIGNGVDVENIERLTDEYAFKQVLKQTTMVGYYTQTSSTYETIEGIFSESSDTGLQEYIDDFFDAWESLADDPTDTAARTTLQTATQNMIDTFHSTSSEISDLKESLNSSIDDDVKQINELTSEIADLNKEIAAVEISGQNANDSRDKRDQLLTELSNYIDIDYTENSLGEVTVTSGGSILVSPESSVDFVVDTTTYTAADGSTVTNIGVKFANSNETYVPTGGELKGLLDSRDTIIPEYEEELDNLANAIVSAVNELHEQGYTLDGISGIDFFDPTSTGASDISLSAAVSADVGNIAAAGGGSVVTANTETVSSIAYGTVYSLAHDNISENSVVVKVGDTTLTEGVDYDIDYTEGTIQMLHSGYDGSDITIDYDYNDGGTAGSGDNTNALSIAALRNSLTMDDGTSSFNDYFASMISELGLQYDNADANMESRTTLLSQYQDQQASTSGVSLDEEEANLIQYQNTYTAAARIVTVVSDMFDSLMNM
jgi:flagellar hook-associated protein 1